MTILSNKQSCYLPCEDFKSALTGGEEIICGSTGHDKHSAELAILCKDLLTGDDKVDKLLLNTEYGGENSAGGTSSVYNSVSEHVSKCRTLLFTGGKCVNEVSCVLRGDCTTFTDASGCVVAAMNDGCIINLGDLALLPATGKPLVAVDSVPMRKEFRDGEQPDNEWHEAMTTVDGTGNNAELLATHCGRDVNDVSPALETNKLTAEPAQCGIKSGQSAALATLRIGNKPLNLGTAWVNHDGFPTTGAMFTLASASILATAA